MKNKVMQRSFYVDDTSKFFIKFESLFGVIRLPILYNPSLVQKSLMIIYIVFNTVTSNILPYFYDKGDGKILKVILRIFESLAYYVYGFTLNTKFKEFYKKIGKIDSGKGLFKDRHCAMLVVSFNVISLGLLYYRKTVVNYVTPFLIIYVAPLRIAHSCESFFFGHLLNSFCVKLKYMMEQIFSSYNTENKSESGKKFTKVIIKKVTSRYYSLFQAFDILIECIQWQVCSLIVATTGIVLLLMQEIATRIIEKSFTEDVWSLFVLFSIALGFVLPFIYLYASAIRVAESVDCFKCLLNALYYSKQFDKHQKSQIKTLLSLMSSKPLNFTMMGMFNIDTTLLLKITHFLFTYLFIILQFKKLYKEIN